jgi:tRNA nucleotidyltransferase (CCA-adding enzyme)
VTGKIYLVGGAVRDGLLGLKPRERDWVVTGATPESLQQQGFRQVGASFPVFLHPETQEEYALARTERKQGHGYHGFTVDFHPGVSLEQDLERRDLTVNAMAQDEQGQLIDPYHGQRDIEARVLRHVSPAFAEDPLRVLRVARFAARFADLGFTVHPETLALMQQMTRVGEIDHLVAERSWAEIESGLATSRPSVFLQVLRDCGALAVLLPEVDALFGIPQDERYHPEIDTALHVQMTLDYAASHQYPTEVRFALLLHDLGKALTPTEQWPSHHQHETQGLPLVREVCQRFKVPTAYRELAERVCELHLRCHRAQEMQAKALLKFLEAADLLRRPERLQPLLQACESDYRGRLGLERRPYPQAGIVAAALYAAQEVKTADLNTEGLSGLEIGQALHAARIAAIGRAINQDQ